MTHKTFLSHSQKKPKKKNTNYRRGLNNPSLHRKKTWSQTRFGSTLARHGRGISLEKKYRYWFSLFPEQMASSGGIDILKGTVRPLTTQKPASFDLVKKMNFKPSSFSVSRTDLRWSEHKVLRWNATTGLSWRRLHRGETSIFNLWENLLCFFEGETFGHITGWRPWLTLRKSEDFNHDDGNRGNRGARRRKTGTSYATYFMMSSPWRPLPKRISKKIQNSNKKTGRKALKILKYTRIEKKTNNHRGKYKIRNIKS